MPLARVTSLSGVSNATTGDAARAARLARGREGDGGRFSRPSRRTRSIPSPVSISPGSINHRSVASAAAYSDIAFQRVEGSNNWVVSGKKTRSGKPILANDPHRAITHPSVRYITHLVGPGWNVIGAGEPASPGVSIGHNERIAFGLTIVGMDQQDVYVEKVGACRGNREQGTGNRCSARSNSVPGSRSRFPPCYFHNGGWQRITTVVDTIRVKGDSARIVRLEFTHHGPIVSSDSARGRAVAIRMVGQEPGTAAYLASLQLGPREELARLPERDGALADAEREHDLRRCRRKHRLDRGGPHAAPALVGTAPRARRRPLRVERLRSVHAQLPQAYNPASGFIATANNNILPPGYKTPIAYDWSSDYRVSRIREVLASRSDFTVADFQALQHDDLSILARQLVPLARLRPRNDSASATRKAVKMLATLELPDVARCGRAAPVRGVGADPRSPRERGASLAARSRDVLGNRADYEELEAFLDGAGRRGIGATRATRCSSARSPKRSRT